MKDKHKSELMEEVGMIAKVVNATQKRPNTCVVIKARMKGKEYIGVGFSKARWPDKWDSLHGIALARKKAVADVVRQVLREEKESGTRSSNE